MTWCGTDIGRAVQFDMPIAVFDLVALDCPDPLALARFYQQIVGGEIKTDPNSDQWVRLELADACDIGFQKDPDYTPPDWPHGEPQQAHLDFDLSDLDAGEAAVLAIGARKADIQPDPDEWRVFIDPVGHPFCLCKV